MSGDDGPEPTCPEMTAALVSEHQFGRQSSGLSLWRVPQAHCIYRECSSFDFVSINQFTIFVFYRSIYPNSL